MTFLHVRQAGPLLTDVLAWCAEHLWSGGDLTSGDLTFQQHYIVETGTRVVSVLGTPPQVMAVSVDLLEQADPQFLKFDRGLLTRFFDEINAADDRDFEEFMTTALRPDFPHPFATSEESGQ